MSNASGFNASMQIFPPLPPFTSRYGASDFIRLWSRCGGNMGLKCFTKDDAGDVPTSLAHDPVLKVLEARLQKEKGAEGDFLDWEVEALEVSKKRKRLYR